MNHDIHRTVPTILFVSNGHGEDLVGARIAQALLRLGPEMEIKALPLVGTGDSYQSAAIPCVGPRRALPSGGLLLHNLPLLVADLAAGFLGLTVAQLRFLARQRCDVLVVVGDVYAQLLASLVRSPARFVVQTLVSAHHAEGDGYTPPNRHFMERITLPERTLMRLRARAVYVRDIATETALRGAGVAQARYLGNPIADGLDGAPPTALAGEHRIVALLPGSRGYRSLALARMLDALELLGEQKVVGAIAWVGETIEPPGGWELLPPATADAGLIGELRKGEARALVYRERFADVLHAARLVLGTSGTANEQAVSLGRPVVAFAVPPYYSSAFLANQKRLLGPALEVVEPTAAAIAEAARRWLQDPARAEQAGRQGRTRIGGPGGSEAIAGDLLNSLQRVSESSSRALRRSES